MSTKIQIEKNLNKIAPDEMVDLSKLTPAEIEIMKNTPVKKIKKKKPTYALEELEEERQQKEEIKDNAKATCLVWVFIIVILIIIGMARGRFLAVGV